MMYLVHKWSKILDWPFCIKWKYHDELNILSRVLADLRSTLSNTYKNAFKTQYLTDCSPRSVSLSNIEY